MKGSNKEHTMCQQNELEDVYVYGNLDLEINEKAESVHCHVTKTFQL